MICDPKSKRLLLLNFTSWLANLNHYDYDYLLIVYLSKDSHTDKYNNLVSGLILY